METVFDHNITPEEWNVIFGINKELYLKIVDEDSAFYHLACLYHLRGAKKDVIQDYLNRIPPTMAKFVFAIIKRFDSINHAKLAIFLINI